MGIAFGKKVSRAFADKVQAIGARLGFDPDWLMTVMAHETVSSFDPGIFNIACAASAKAKGLTPIEAGCAVGLIQFLPSTAAGLLGLDRKKSADRQAATRAFSRMSGLAQLDYVEKFYAPFRGRIHSLEDLAAIAATGAPARADGVLYDYGTKAWEANAPKEVRAAGRDYLLSDAMPSYYGLYKRGTGKEYGEGQTSSGGGALLLVGGVLVTLGAAVYLLHKRHPIRL